MPELDSPVAGRNKRLPSGEDLKSVRAPSVTPDIRVPGIDYGPMAAAGRAMEKGVDSLAAGFNAKAAAIDEVDDYETQKRLIDFRRATEQDYEAYKREIAPGGEGFQAGWDARYGERAKAAFGKDAPYKIPTHLQKKVDLKLVELGEGTSTHAQKYEYAERDRYFVADIEDQFTGLKRDVEANPARLAEKQKEATSLLFGVEGQGGAPIESRLKPTLHKRVLRDLEKTARDALVLGATTADDFKRAEETLFVSSPVKPERAQKGDAGQLFKGPDQAKPTGPVADPGIRALGAPPDFRDQSGDAASIRFNNPGAMYPGPSSKKFGAVATETIGGGHKIAVFPDAVSGAAAQFDLLGRKYANRTVADALKEWSGGNSVDSYLKVIERETGLKPGDKLTSETLKDPAIAIPFAKAMAVQEAGKAYPLSDAQWQAGFDLANSKTSGEAPAASGLGGPGEGVRAPVDPSLRWAKEETGEESYAGPFQNSSLSERITTYKQLEAKRKQLSGAVEAEIKTYEDSATKGILPPEGYLADLTEKVERLGDPQTKAYFDSVMGLAALTAQFSKMPPLHLESLLRAERTQNTDAAGTLRLTPVAAKRLAHLETLLDNTKKAVNIDPNGWAHKVGLETFAVVDFNNDAALQRHVEQSRRVGAYLGQEPKFFSPNQRDVLTDTMRVGGGNMMGVLSKIVKNFGPDAGSALGEFAKDVPEAAWIGGMMLDAERNGGANLQFAMDAAQSVQMRRDKNFKKVVTSNAEHRTMASDALGTTFRQTPGNFGAAIATADAIYEARAFKEGLTTVDPDKWKEGLNAALGQHSHNNKVYGGITYQNTGWFGLGKGDPVLVPTNVEKSGLRDLVASIRREDVFKSSGYAGEDETGPMTGSGKPLPMADIQRATLVTVGPGQYWLALGDPEGDPQWAKTSTGRNYVLDLDALEPVLRKRRPDLYFGYTEPVSQGPGTSQGPSQGMGP